MSWIQWNTTCPVQEGVSRHLFDFQQEKLGARDDPAAVTFVFQFAGIYLTNCPPQIGAHPFMVCAHQHVQWNQKQNE